jgi:hypothetical protein
MIREGILEAHRAGREGVDLHAVGFDLGSESGGCTRRAWTTEPTLVIALHARCDQRREDAAALLLLPQRSSAFDRGRAAPVRPKQQRPARATGGLSES